MAPSRRTRRRKREATTFKLEQELCVAPVRRLKSHLGSRRRGVPRAYAEVAAPPLGLAACFLTAAARLRAIAAAEGGRSRAGRTFGPPARGSRRALDVPAAGAC